MAKKKNSTTVTGCVIRDSFRAVLETRWLGGSFLMIYRNNAGRLGSDFIYVSLETGWLGQKPWFLIAGLVLYVPGQIASSMTANCSAGVP